MIAIIHRREPRLEELYRQHGLFLGADNFYGHFTLAGREGDLDLFQQQLKDSGYNFSRLPVRYAFHSPLMEDAGRDFMRYLTGISFSLPVTGQWPRFFSGLYGEEREVMDGTYFWDVVSRYIDFPCLLRNMEERGPCLYIDLGPSGSLATFIRYNLGPEPASSTMQVMTPFQREKQQLCLLQEMIRNR
jgi:acyl transferase domain-containing protein